MKYLIFLRKSGATRGQLAGKSGATRGQLGRKSGANRAQILVKSPGKIDFRSVFSTLFGLRAHFRVDFRMPLTVDDGLRALREWPWMIKMWFVSAVHSHTIPGGLTSVIYSRT